MRKYDIQEKRLQIPVMVCLVVVLGAVSNEKIPPLTLKIMKIHMMITFILFSLNLVNAISDPADAFWRYFAEEWAPQIHRKIFNHIAPIVPPSKAIVLEASIKNDLVAPILGAYRQELQSFNGNQALSAFDASLAWIVAAEKHWIHWSANVFPVIMKDSHM